MAGGDGWTLFLDRDGVINKRLMGDYVKSWEAFEFLPGVLEALKILPKHFDRIIIVTNQQGIGKGEMTEAALHDIHQKMLGTIEASGGRIDAIFHCPDLATEPDNCRKPSPAMAYEARQEFPQLSFDRSVVVGDTQSDIEFGKYLGMKTVFVGSPYDYESLGVSADWRFDHLLQFALHAGHTVN
jgi:D-glycero-D-manno-heptose 1,7-bisphosphate phosphatase